MVLMGFKTGEEVGCYMNFENGCSAEVLAGYLNANDWERGYSNQQYLSAN